MGCWKSAKGKWRKLWLLPWPLRLALVQAIMLLPLVRLGLRVLGLRHCQRILGQLSEGTPPGKADPALALEQARDLAALVRAAAGVTGGTCLRQSLVLWYLLRRRGISCQLRFGSSVQAGRFESHAWVECEGESLDQVDPLQRFSAFQKPSTAGRAEPKL